MFWIVSYDVPDNRRRAKVAKILEGYGRRAQYSVFECEIDSEKSKQLADRLREVIDPAEDDVRFYPLNRADLRRVKLLGIAELRRAQSYYIVQKRDVPDNPDHPF